MPSMNIQFCSILLEQRLEHRARAKTDGKTGRVTGNKPVGSEAGKSHRSYMQKR